MKFTCGKYLLPQKHRKGNCPLIPQMSQKIDLPSANDNATEALKHRKKIPSADFVDDGENSGLQICGICEISGLLLFF